MSKVKQIIKNNKILYSIALACKSAIYWLYERWASFRWSIEKKLIKKGVIKQDPRFETIKNVKNTHIGERCFIVATGPSVKIEDLEALRGEFTISMNSILNVFSNTSYRPDIYMCADGNVFNTLKDKFDLIDHKNIYIGIANTNRLFQGAIYLDDVKGFNDVNLVHGDAASICWQYRFRDGKKIKFGFSDDCFVEFGSGTSITHFAVQLAAYMGFKNIYLMGVDANYSGKRIHIGEYLPKGFEFSLKDADASNKWINNMLGYDERVLKKRGINLYNATRGGKLKTVPRVNLDDVLNIES